MNDVIGKGVKHLGKNCSGSYDVVIKLASLRYNIDQLQGLFAQWEQRFGCELQERAGRVTLLLGRNQAHQLMLRGKKCRKYLYVYAGQILGTKLQEDSLIELMERIITVQTNDMDIFGLVISKAGQHERPLVVHNGQIYDEAIMMDLLWKHYSSTKVRESRKIEEVYHFLRDVPSV
jgi:hypothetical protein